MRTTHLFSGTTLRRGLLALAGSVMILGAAACGSSKSTEVASPAATTATAATGAASTAADTPATQPGATITIDNFTFASPPSVSPGATVTVKNSDPAEHSVTADSGNAFNVEIEGGETATLTAPTSPGTYDYHCSYHPMMHGQLIVK